MCALTVLQFDSRILVVNTKVSLNTWGHSGNTLHNYVCKCFENRLHLYLGELPEQPGSRQKYIYTVYVCMCMCVSEGISTACADGFVFQSILSQMALCLLLK